MDSFSKCVGKHLEPIEEKRAKQRQIATLKKGNKKPVTLKKGERKDKHHKGETDTKVAKQLGVSREQYRKIKTIRDKAPTKIKNKWTDKSIKPFFLFFFGEWNDKFMMRIC